MKVFLSVIAFCFSSVAIHAEDWATTDGRIYKDVKVEKYDAVSVSISDSDGGVSVPLSTLPPDLQKKFNYNPVKAATFTKEQVDKDAKFEQDQKDLEQKQLALLKGLFFSALATPPSKAILYSLEPWDRPTAEDKTFQNTKILGQMDLNPMQTEQVAKVFQKSAEDWNGISAACFDPRQGLRIISGGHTYDFLICFSCQGIAYYKDDKSIGDTGVTGSPDFLKSLLAAAHVPLSKTDEESPDKVAAEIKKNKDEETRWFAGMPKFIQTAWNWQTINNDPFPDIALYRGLVIREYPDVPSRILKLLEWNGSGAGPWTGFPSYETAPELLLFDYSTPTILEAIQSTKLDDTQIEGTARFFGGWDYSQRRTDRSKIPSSLKQTLLAHCLKSGDEDKIARAKAAFK